MSLLPISLIAKASLGVGIIGLAISLPLFFANKAEKQNRNRRGGGVALVEREDNRLSSNDLKIRVALDKLAGEGCHKMFLDNKRGKEGDLYICPARIDRERESLEGLWYLDLESKSRSDNSEVLKKVVSIKYQEKSLGGGEHILFRLEEEESERKLYVDSDKGWNHFGANSSFKDLEFLLSEFFPLSK